MQWSFFHDFLFLPLPLFLSHTRFAELVKRSEKVGGYFWPFGTISTYSILKRFVATCQITENDQEVWWLLDTSVKAQSVPIWKE